MLTHDNFIGLSQTTQLISNSSTGGKKKTPLTRHVTLYVWPFVILNKAELATVSINMKIGFELQNTHINQCCLSDLSCSLKVQGQSVDVMVHFLAAWMF